MANRRPFVNVSGSIQEVAAADTLIMGTARADTTIGVGAATPSTSGAGITFPATQNPSSDVNTLDDYEEGTWTPVDASGASLSFSNVVGVYNKVGNMVTTLARYDYPVTASGAGALVGGMPFTIGVSGGGSIGYSSSTLASRVTGIAGSVTQTITTSAGGGLTNSNLSGSIIQTQITYTV